MEVLDILSESLENVRRARNIKPTDEIKTSALRWELYASLQNLLDGMAVIIMGIGARQPSVYGELGTILREHNILTADEEGYVKEIARVRSILAHAYPRLRPEDLQAVIDNILPLVEVIASKLVSFVGKRPTEAESK